MVATVLLALPSSSLVNITSVHIAFHPLISVVAQVILHAQDLQCGQRLLSSSLYKT